MRWHGWSKQGEALSLHIGHLPGRKSLCLYADYGGEIDALAYFPSEQHAIKALQMLDWLTAGREPGEEHEG